MQSWSKEEFTEGLEIHCKDENIEVEETMEKLVKKFQEKYLALK
jgi:hypothetical protein